VETQASLYHITWLASICQEEHVEKKGGGCDIKMGELNKK
jgi:hypothetical protein